MISSNSPLVKLRQGNKRFVTGTSYNRPVNLSKHTSQQSPFAVILGCSDSRVPLEIVFDAGIGELFVVRVAGNLAGPSQIASIEFAVSNFGCPLIVVLGHSSCGAVTAAVEPKSDAEKPSTELSDLVEEIRAGVDVASLAPEARLETAIRQNIHSTVRKLRGRRNLHDMYELGKLSIVGAEYSLETGIVEFFE